ncbi:MAG: preprotein translocase subunit SecG [Gallintestinimicrobium sp.]
MEILRIILTVIFIVMCIALTVLVLMQEGKQQGLGGAISGAADSYWGKNKGRSMEGLLVKITKWLAIGFMVIAVILNITRIWG